MEVEGLRKYLYTGHRWLTDPDDAGNGRGTGNVTIHPERFPDQSYSVILF